MNAGTSESAAQDAQRRNRFRRWRGHKDAIAHWVIAVGGIAVIAAVGLIFFYLVWVVFPLFTPASADLRFTHPDTTFSESRPVWLSLEEQREVGLRISTDGLARFFDVRDGREISAHEVIPGPLEIVHATAEAGEPGLIALAASSGEIFLVGHRYALDYSDGVEDRVVRPLLEFPRGEEPLLSLEAGVTDLALASDDASLVVAALGRNGTLAVYRGVTRANPITGEVAHESTTATITLQVPATTIAVSGDMRWVYVGDTLGQVSRVDLAREVVVETVTLVEGAVTELSMLLGGISLLAGDDQGNLVQAFPVRAGDNRLSLQPVRSFEKRGAAVLAIHAEPRRKGFVVRDAAGGIGFYHSTAGQRALELEPGEIPVTDPLAIGLAPRGNGLLVEGANGGFSMLTIDNPHPDVSWSSLWQKVWYENYPEPDYVWQSSAANTDFEPKFSLTPLLFGTLKAALYAMLFAVPLALAAAAYTAYFMAPAVREAIKPTIETMAALPTVVLGFLAGLWFAPFVERNLAGIFGVALLVPAGVLAFAWGWQRYRGPLKRFVAPGWEPVLLIPVIVLLTVLAMAVADPVQDLLFGGDLRSWLTQQAGIDYDQRNALVVGCAMGFAVIPTIFSIAEDAFYGVPRPLSTGSLALGATPWQTLVHVVLPTASPGIFSALMIGFGRAVGETMIVLMATGNTPIMEWNIFEGMRTLAANIAVEMPESAVASSHYRVLFLAALVLFVFTFVVNTGAEVVRQRLRVKYSSL